VKVRDAEQHEIANAQVSLLLASNGKTNPPVRAQYDAATRSYTAEIRAPSAGTFTVMAVASAGAARLGDDCQLLVAESLDLEMGDVRARPDFMAKLAKDSNGENFQLVKNVSVSPAYAFAKAPPPSIEYRRTAAWDKAVWLTLILGLLAGEWALRRAKGLA
jgi:hypothetical protein